MINLSRMAVAPWMPPNTTGILLGKSLQALQAIGRERLAAGNQPYRVATTNADPGEGHTGHVYLAGGWDYAGLGTKNDKWVNAAGQTISRKATKTRDNATMEALGHTGTRATGSTATSTPSACTRATASACGSARRTCGRR